MGEPPKDFSYVARGHGSVEIRWRGRPAKTLTGHAAQRFTARADDASDEQLQMLMARATGNFKRGNERRG